MPTLLTTDPKELDQYTFTKDVTSEVDQYIRENPSQLLDLFARVQMAKDIPDDLRKIERQIEKDMIAWLDREEAANRPTADELFDTLSKTIDQLVAIADSCGRGSYVVREHVAAFVARKFDAQKHAEFTGYLNRNGK
ncbi:hypothetical protein MZK49_05570 [Ensifer sesbaniae]|uniref:hypothetical protein n=1 Tax=Ensifer sesbaniae TaxID=1214071 RepID=UPI0020016A50|nr:hypothetical protein [Ensifer sesbaniae]